MKFKCNNHQDFLEALKMNIDFHEVRRMELSRISELTQRTNRCTNGIRYTVKDIQKRTAMNHVTMYSLSDRFSDLELVGAFEVEEGVLTIFCLSCRALGYELEKSHRHHFRKT